MAHFRQVEIQEGMTTSNMHRKYPLLKEGRLESQQVGADLHQVALLTN